MLATSSSEIVEASCGTTNAGGCNARGISEAASILSLTRNENLFRKGDARAQLYRVERGALCHYIRWDSGRHEIIEFAFPGDIIGFGHHSTHISTAQAMVETEVSLVTPHDFEDALEADGQLSARLAAASDREFEYFRTQAIKKGQGRPVRRVASFLTALSHMSAREGRDPTLITEEIPSGVVAEQLHMSADCLADAIRQLKCRGLVARCAVGLRIVDIGTLQKFADAA